MLYKRPGMHGLDCILAFQKLKFWKRLRQSNSVYSTHRDFGGISVPSLSLPSLPSP